jgi:single-stranded-DNA-specific exonuclease
MYTFSLLKNFWIEEEYSRDVVNRIISEHKTSYIIARLLYLVPNLEFEQVPDFLNPKMKNLMPNPNHLLDMPKAVERIYTAITKKEKITIFGDYDVDGATSSAIIHNYLKSIGVDSEIYIPDRVREGYGPNIEAMKTIAANGTKLLITVDCGTVAFEPLEEAHAQGMDAIVIDHHLGVSDVPKSIAIINPNRLDETTPLKYLCGAGVSFMLVVALNSFLREKNFFTENKEPNLLELLPLVALGTVCDVMNLVSLNRAFVTTGLQVLESWNKSTWGNVGLMALKEICGIERFDEQTFGFTFGPCINAGGRIGLASLGAKLLTETSHEKALSIAQKLYELNIERRQIEKQMKEEAIFELEQKYSSNSDFTNIGFIFIGSEKYHQGVIGILASRLKDKYNKPAFVFSQLEGYIKASARSIIGIDLGATINRAVKKGLLIAGGGHAMAGGFSCANEKVEQLKQFFEEEISQKAMELTKIRLQTFACELSLSAVNLELYEEIQKLKPFGQGNSRPVFVIRGVEIVFSQKRGQIHLAATFMDESGTTLKGMFFSFFEHCSEMNFKNLEKERLDILCEISLNEWNGRKTVELMIQDIAISGNISTPSLYG